MSHPDFILDKRVVARNLRKGIITKEDVEKHVAKLTDVEDNAEICQPDAAPPADEDTTESE